MNFSFSDNGLFCPSSFRIPLLMNPTKMLRQEDIILIRVKHVQDMLEEFRIYKTL